MKTFAVYSLKGGSGKSTLARHGSVILSAAGLVDLDPQGTSKRWMARRKALGLTRPAAIVANWYRLPALLDQAKEKGFQNIIIDVPPHYDDLRAARAAVDAADLVVVPCKASQDDIEVVADTLQFIGSKPFVLVLTMVKRSRLTIQAAEILVKYGRLAPTLIWDRVAYPEAAMIGKSVTETNKNGDAALEMISLWTWLAEQA
jgi:chromosome partitioning protein